MSNIPKTTKEFYFPGPEINSYDNLKVRHSEIPQLKPTQVLVKNHAVSLQFRDLMISRNQYFVPTNPGLVPGSDMAGEIVALGEDVKDWKVGDRVCPNFSPEHIYGDPSSVTLDATLGAIAQGVLTEYKAFYSYSLVKIPDHLTYEEASTLPCAGLTAYNALLGSTPVKGGDVVVVQGTGGVSIWGLQIAVASGAIVIATSSSDEKLKLAKKLGATHLINYKTTPDWDAEVLKLTGGRGADHILEVGGADTLGKSLNSTRFGGHIHVIGRLAGSALPTDIIVPLVSRSLHMHGIQIGSVQLFKEFNRLLEAEPVKTKPVVDTIFDFDDTAKAYAYLESQKHVGKVVIKISQ